MCGIAGIVWRETADPDLIGIMAQTLAHRGPDGEGEVTLEGCSLGHRRLSIIDLATGSQPMADHTRRYWIVFNGEIYNYRQLRKELEHRGHQFLTQSDTEVLLEAYKENGSGMLAHIKGQFAFAVWDRDERSLFAARDRLGEKPFFYACSDLGNLLFASEIKALLAAKLIKPRIDLVSLDAYLDLLYVPTDRTIYENIHSLRPGHALQWKKGTMQIWRYWQPQYSQGQINDPFELCERLQELISRAVESQMVADVPVGAFLSGGLDSSTIVALMSRCTTLPIKTFSVGFGGMINELPYARAVAEKYQTEHHEIQVNIPLAEMLEKMAVVYDEPFADSSNIPTYLLAKYTSQFVKVALSGDGGDELFGGYDWYGWLFDPKFNLKKTHELLFIKAMSLALRVLARCGLPLGKARDTTNQIWLTHRKKLEYPNLWERHLALTTNLYRKRTDFRGERPVDALPAVQAIYRPAEEVTGLDTATDFDLRCYLPGDILTKVDRAALAHGLESRAPFLDVDLVEFVMSIPWQTRFRGNSKQLLRDACQQYWPKEILGRRKQGFGAPLDQWTAHPDIAGIFDRILAPSHPMRHLFPSIPTGLNRMRAQDRWTLLCLGLWLEKNETCLTNL